MTTADPSGDFAAAKAASIQSMAQSEQMLTLSRQWIDEAAGHRYTYLFEALGRPIIQLPQDMIALSELIWTVKPDLIVETGIAHGGSLIYSAAQLALLDYCDAAASKSVLDPSTSKRQVIGVDIEIRDHNRAAIEAHPLSGMITMVSGSSIDHEVFDRVRNSANQHETVMVLLDSNHSHAHVQAELELYAPLVSVGSYCIVYDTVVEFMAPDSFPNRPWNVGDNPYTATLDFLARHSEFVVDHEISDRLMLTVAPSGYLKRVTE